MNFDNVIKDLKWLVSLGQRARASDVAELHAAIRVLEAAGKVDKDRGVQYIDERIDFEYDGYFGPPYDSFLDPESTKKQDEGVMEEIAFLQTIRALLESLPDPATERTDEGKERA